MLRKYICTALIILIICTICTLAACSKSAEADPPEPEVTEDVEWEAVIETPDVSAPPAPPDIPTPPPEESVPPVINEEYLSHVTVDEGYELTTCAEGTGAEYEYVIYELEDFDVESEYERKVYWIIIVLQDGEVHTVLRQDADEYAAMLLTADSLVLEVDADFDGVHDILLGLGHFGNQGLLRYACYLRRGDEFVECPSFAEIPNPAIDAENKVILSNWRSHAASHSYAMFYFADGEFVETERLTTAEEIADSGEGLWTWTDKILVDGEWQIREYLTASDYTDEVAIFDEKVYSPDAH